MIYVIRAVGTNYYKIGHSDRDDYSLRLNELQTGSPYDLETLLYIDGDAKDEKRIHDALSSFRTRREWFEIDPDKMFVVMFSAILLRKPEYKLVHEGSRQYKDHLKALWTPGYFVQQYYYHNKNSTFSTATGITLDELWLKYVEVTQTGGMPIDNKKTFLTHLKNLSVPFKAFDGKIYFHLQRKELDKTK